MRKHKFLLLFYCLMGYLPSAVHEMSYFLFGGPLCSTWQTLVFSVLLRSERECTLAVVTPQFMDNKKELGLSSSADARRETSPGGLHSGTVALRWTGTEDTVLPAAWLAFRCPTNCFLSQIKSCILKAVAPQTGPSWSRDLWKTHEMW